MIKLGKAYVCDLNQEDMKKFRGTLTSPGKNSPYRDRSVEENLSLFERMKNGEFDDGSKTLRAKIDMSSPNLNMRDPAIYRILHKSHQRQGNKWCIYPLYDYAHPIEDAIEGVTHSLCSIEFENHRPLYDWVINNLDFKEKPHQYEFARLNVTYTVMSKRYLRELVETGVVEGWDDPRMPTISGLRRRGYTPSSIMSFIEKAGVSKTYSLVDEELLQYCIREELNSSSQRRIGILDPVKVEITNYPDKKEEMFEIPNHPQDPSCGTRNVKFTKYLYVDRDDVSIDPPPKFFRIKLGAEVRLMGSYIIKCTGIDKDDSGNVICVKCEADLDTRNGIPSDGRKIKGTIHWLSQNFAKNVKIKVYDQLFKLRDMSKMEEGKCLKDYINEKSCVVYNNAVVEPSVFDDSSDTRYQFVRTGYFIRDMSSNNCFNRIVSLKDRYKPS